jgi:hypothetical protein
VAPRITGEKSFSVSNGRFLYSVALMALAMVETKIV